MLILFFPMAGAVCAGLGDSADKIEDSYGSLVSRHLRDDGMVAVLYQKDRYLYTVTFDHGVSVSEEYSRVDKANLSEREIARFLKMNAGPKMTWSRAEAASPGQGSRFERSDHKAEAMIATRASLKVRSKI
jgi:hypothetical protein